VLLREKLHNLVTQYEDVTEFLGSIPLKTPIGKLRAESHLIPDACHLAHGQNIREQPPGRYSTISGLTKIGELKRVQLCCGSAAYNLNRTRNGASVALNRTIWPH